mmetsp:Transcript_32572/g.56392  ORF Transcript_32572/g.56392 Transcript_32572/m.56392 type:complete len:209 (-) Transcript_32572:2941-3567(-)
MSRAPCIVAHILKCLSIQQALWEHLLPISALSLDSLLRLRGLCLELIPLEPQLDLPLDQQRALQEETLRSLAALHLQELLLGALLLQLGLLLGDFLELRILHSGLSRQVRLGLKQAGQGFLRSQELQASRQQDRLAAVSLRCLHLRQELNLELRQVLNQVPSLLSLELSQGPRHSLLLASQAHKQELQLGPAPLLLLPLQGQHSQPPS